MAIYTEISDEQAIEILAQYDIGDFQSITPISAGITNSNYIIKTNLDQFVLTIFEDIRDIQTSVEEARAEQNISVNFMAHLHKNGLSVPEPKTMRNGDKQFTIQDGQKYGAIFSFVPGTVIEPNDLTVAHCQDLGICLARIHKAANNFDQTKENPFGRQKWQHMFDRMVGKIPHFEEETGYANLKRDILQAISDINENWPNTLPHGMVHGDLFPDNVLFDQDKITGIIDLHDVCYDAYAYDLAICINAWCFTEEGDEITFHPAKARAIIMGYSQFVQMSDSANMHFPLICQAASMRFLMTRLFDWLNPIEGAVVTMKNPIPYYKRLQFHQKMPDFNAYINSFS